MSMTVRPAPLNYRLRAMREAAGFTQDSLARAISTSPATVAKIEARYHDWLPAPATVRTWAAATGQQDHADELLAMLADLKADAAREAVTRRAKPGWCSAHRQPRSECRPDQTHVYSYRARGDLMAEVERQAPRGDLSGFITRALMAATGWEPPAGKPLLAPGRPPVKAPAGSRDENGHSPAPVPAVPAADATAPAEGKNAATRGRRIAEARERAQAVGAPLVAAKDLPRPEAAAVFKAGPDVDCLHENMRIGKGVCPDCKQWVTK